MSYTLLLNNKQEIIFMIKTVVKRDGSTQKFQLKKVTHSLQKSMKRAKKRNGITAEILAKEVYLHLLRKGFSKISSEQIRDAVDSVLKSHNLGRVYEAYSLMWLYRHPVKIKAVSKRHGGEENFNVEKIFKSIHKSMRQAHVHSDKFCEIITKDVIKRLEKEYGREKIDTYKIREAIIYVLTKKGLNNIARFYILHKYL